MGQGLQIFNANGVCILNTSHKLSRVLGDFYTNGATSGVITDANLPTGTFWFAQTLCYNDSLPSQIYPPILGAGCFFAYVNGTTLNWAINYDKAILNFHVYYGVY